MAGLIGIDKVIRNLSAAIEMIEGGVQAGVLKAALHERGEAQKLTPVDEGNLKNSAYVVSGTVTSKDASFVGKKAGQHAANHNVAVNESKGDAMAAKMPMAIMGFSAFYAVFVHEINKNYNVGQWKYLETVLIRDRKLILDIIRRKAKSYEPS